MFIYTSDGGVVILDVPGEIFSGSLSRGDVISTINNHRVYSIENMVSILSREMDDTDGNLKIISKAANFIYFLISIY